MNRHRRIPYGAWKPKRTLPKHSVELSFGNAIHSGRSHCRHEDVYSRDDDSAIEKARELLNAGTLRMIERWKSKERVAVLEKGNS